MYPQQIKHANCPVKLIDPNTLGIADLIADLGDHLRLGLRRVISLDGEIMGHFNTKNMTSCGPVPFGENGGVMWAFGMVNEPCAFTLRTKAEYLYNMGESTALWGSEIIRDMQSNNKAPIGLISITTKMNVDEAVYRGHEDEIPTKTREWLCYGEFFDGFFLVQDVPQCEPMKFMRFPEETFIRFVPIPKEN